jgi:hypothetical protein
MADFVAHPAPAAALRLAGISPVIAISCSHCCMPNPLSRQNLQKPIASPDMFFRNNCRIWSFL